jgi:hypothetical protein
MKCIVEGTNTLWYSGNKLCSNAGDFKRFLTCKRHNSVFKIVKQSEIIICFPRQPDEFKRTSSRIVILTSYMTSLVLLAAYSAFLISSLAVQPRYLPFRDLQGLANGSSYRLGVLRNSSDLNIFYVWQLKYLWLVSLLVVDCGRVGKHVRRRKYELPAVMDSVIKRKLPHYLRLCIRRLYTPSLLLWSDPIISHAISTEAIYRDSELS